MSFLHAVEATFNGYDTVPLIQVIQEMFTYTNVCVLGDLPGLWGQCVFLGVSDHFKRSLTKNCHVMDLLSVFAAIQTHLKNHE